MRWARFGDVVKWIAGIVASVQALTLAALVAVDAYRKRIHRQIEFPHEPPRELPTEDADVTIYTKGADLFADMIASIDTAKDRVYLETYIWKSDEVGQAFKDAVTRAADRGVQVYLVYDVFGNLVVPQPFFSFADSIHVLRHAPWSGTRGLWHPRSPGLNHRKLLVVDGVDAFIGGYNIGSDYATRWRDTHARLHGPVVAELENAFIDYWNSARHRRLPLLKNPKARVWDSSVKITRNVPSAMVYPIRYTYLEAIDRASRRLWLTHAYLIPDDDLTFALIDAARRGVDVRIIVPAESNHIVADWLSRGLYRLFLSNGVRLFLYQGAMVHAKTATIDGLWSTIGTANLDRLSLVGNYEINIEITDPDVAAGMEDIFELDLTNCRELTLDGWNSRPIVQKLSETILTPFRPLL